MPTVTLELAELKQYENTISKLEKEVEILKESAKTIILHKK